jgi:Leucine-rich repeat (LRR) protein
MDPTSNYLPKAHDPNNAETYDKIVLNRDVLARKFKHNLMDLTSISLRECHIEKIDKETFRGLDNCFSIDLGNNHLKEIDGEIFKGLKNLREVYLDNNELDHLDKDIFKGLTELRAVYLNDNKFATPPELNLEEHVQYLTFKHGWQNDFVFDYSILVDIRVK